MKTKVTLKLAFLVFLLGFTIQTFSKTKNTNIMNITKNETIGLLVIMKAKTGKEQDVKNFLLGGLALVNQEPQTVSWFAFQIDNNTFGIYDTFEVEEGSYKRENNGRISAVLYDILSGKYEYCVYENKSTPAPKLTPMKYDSSYYDKLELLNYLPEHEDTQPEHLYKLAYVRAKRKSKDLWLDSQSKPCFFKAMFKREDQYLNATFLVKVNSFKDLDQDGVKGFSIRVYSLGHIEHELCFFEDGSTQIKRNVHL